MSTHTLEGVEYTWQHGRWTDGNDMLPPVAIRKKLDRLLEQDFAKRYHAENLELRERALAPYRATIDRYVLRFSDEKLNFPGAGRVFPGLRSWHRTFIEDYVVEHGAVPSTAHFIDVTRKDTSLSGPYHDFSDLPAFHEAVLAEHTTEKNGAPSAGRSS
jgi:hypothetical protein